MAYLSELVDWCTWNSICHSQTRDHQKRQEPRDNDRECDVPPEVPKIVNVRRFWFCLLTWFCRHLVWERLAKTLKDWLGLGHKVHEVGWIAALPLNELCLHFRWRIWMNFTSKFCLKCSLKEQIRFYIFSVQIDLGTSPTLGLKREKFTC